jgi:hypothetical protein
MARVKKFLISDKIKNNSATAARLMLTSPPNGSHLRMSLKEIKKQSQIPGKGQNETLEIFIPMVLTRFASEAVREHVPENGGT